ncbi:MAG: EAL domain-containing protein [Pseudomonadota bacterium]
MLVVRVDGRVVSIAAGDPEELRRGLGSDDLSGQFLDALWPTDAVQSVRQRVRDATRRRLVSNLELTIDDQYGKRMHDVTVLPHARDRALVVCRDTTRRASFEREVRDLAFRDPVTGLPNRAAFLRELGDRLNDARLVGRTVSLLRVNLRRLDYINRTFGRNAGTALVSSLAERAQTLLDSPGPDRPLPPGVTAFLARTEGNEYALVVEGTAETETLAALARSLVEHLTQPERLDSADDDVSVDVSVGIARFPQDADDIDTLLANAGVALYDARKHAASAVEFFSSTAQVRSLSRMDLATELRWALQNDQFHVVYQPWFDLGTGEARGAEALLRWEHPLRGQVPLSEILPVAQMNDLCDALGDWVLTRAAHDAANHTANQSLPIAVNLFARQSFSPRLVERATEIVSHYGVAPERIWFEIRAADFLRDMMSAEATARALGDAGFHVVLDDCGFEALSPRALLRTGIDQIKLGRRLIQRLPEKKAQRVVASHLGLVEPLGIGMCATGVQDADELEALRRVGCKTAQGFLLGRPADELPTLDTVEAVA